MYYSNTRKFLTTGMNIQAPKCIEKSNTNRIVQLYSTCRILPRYSRERDIAVWLARVGVFFRFLISNPIRRRSVRRRGDRRYGRAAPGSLAAWPCCCCSRFAVFAAVSLESARETEGALEPAGLRSEALWRGGCERLRLVLCGVAGQAKHAAGHASGPAGSAGLRARRPPERTAAWRVTLMSEISSTTSAWPLRAGRRQPPTWPLRRPRRTQTNSGFR